MITIKYFVIAGSPGSNMTATYVHVDPRPPYARGQSFSINITFYSSKACYMKSCNLIASLSVWLFTAHLQILALKED